MNIKLSVLVASLSVFMAASVHAHGIEGSLGYDDDNTDIIKFNCDTLDGVTIDHAFATVQDLLPVKKPQVNVKIAPWVGNHCGAFSSAEPDTTDDDGLASAEVEAPVAAVGGSFCVKVFKKAGNQNTNLGKKTADGAEDYEVDAGCGQEGVEDHAAPIFDRYIKNQ